MSLDLSSLQKAVLSLERAVRICGETAVRFLPDAAYLCRMLEQSND